MDSVRYVTVRPVVKKALLFAWVVVAIGCTMEGSSLRSRSAGDLHCPAADLRIYKLDERSFRVVGCSQEVVYFDTCDIRTTGRTCTWVMNSSDDQARKGTTELGAASAPAPGGGCSFDNQCKGDRVCVQHQCVSPAAGATSP